MKTIIYSNLSINAKINAKANLIKMDATPAQMTLRHPFVPIPLNKFEKIN